MSRSYDLARQLAYRIFKPTPSLDERLAGMEHVFHAPPFTPELVTTVKLIAPHLHFSADETCRLVWERDQNGACWGEYEALAPLLNRLPPPRTILEVGPGLGRSVVFFSKKLHWDESDIHLYEGDGHTTKYALMGPRMEESFCGNINLLRYILTYNGILNVTIFDARQWKLPDLPGPYDLLYSFYSIGYHWSLEHFLEDLLSLMHDASIAVFIVPAKFKSFPKMEQLSYRIFDFNAVWPKGCRHKMLVLSKGACIDQACPQSVTSL